ncbi:iron-sulfur binding protein [Alkalihalobacillus alcalophilus ATCC 27647 = CGMCC 1.3604]|uniref:Methylated-DNA--protein-cysteine methyltransferase n=1 Tax=Alkalihalobacillus alcalophilus ATCC 27647 = CGMCC 1.3604 TaxID=1218173 RepID=A0A094WEA9_ALKAL|nr:methylated-DNA--[protein]-cysteine S-methyltransferase [Alkalihalobacillus alcalophilus]KGA96089.1 [Fe-S]-binding protein [Alkalihalobacillus alcalophilus ATCC 27647 = CGMCC 1.3604]MED1561080.1 methylated-DNA--[protein]-cysteine S-methyltransferase [Alkalihalobacillus alcalophilus]THG90084.1 iron-sulfur binding protein [Alkalihalobacillus alcalophilus ATCC 27647 = CGMCC 1.3604]
MTTQNCIFQDEMNSPIGPLTILATDKGVCHIHFGSFDKSTASLNARLKKLGLKGEYVSCNDTLTEVKKQLNEYFNGERKYFDVAIDLHGTAFQQKVWNALMKIEYGETSSYKAVAEMIGSPKAVRAIGGANNQNPLPIIIPCHRVIGSNGNMVGYGGGLDKKEHLLMLEGSLAKLSS